MSPPPGLWLRTLRAVRSTDLPIRPNPIPWFLPLVAQIDQDAVEVRVCPLAPGTMRVTVWVARAAHAPHYDPDTGPVLTALATAGLQSTWLYRSESLCPLHDGTLVRVLAWVYTCRPPVRFRFYR